MTTSIVPVRKTIQQSRPPLLSGVSLGGDSPPRPLERWLHYRAKMKTQRLGKQAPISR